MKALIIIFACILLAVSFRAIDFFASRKKIHSVGAKSNKYSKDIAKFDITDQAQLDEAVKYYKDLVD